MSSEPKHRKRVYFETTPKTILYQLTFASGSGQDELVARDELSHLSNHLDALLFAEEEDGVSGEEDEWTVEPQDPGVLHWMGVLPDAKGGTGLVVHTDTTHRPAVRWGDHWLRLDSPSGPDVQARIAALTDARARALDAAFAVLDPQLDASPRGPEPGELLLSWFALLQLRWNVTISIQPVQLANRW